MTFPRISFDLVEQPWIPVLPVEGDPAEVSIRELFHRAPSIRIVSGDIPTQGIAIQRMLLAIVRRSIDWGSQPVSVWERIWHDGMFPLAEIDDYLDRVRDRFDLLDPDVPFYQVHDFQTPSGTFKSASALIADIPSGAKYFTTRAGSGAERLEFAEAARWVVHCQAFDPSGIKTGDARDARTKGGKGYPIGIAWAGQLGGVIFEGDSLFHTLLLNTVIRKGGVTTIRPGDLPAWERSHLGVEERDDLVPSGPTDVLTWQSRRICLQNDGEFVTGALIGNGDPIVSYNQHDVEFMTAWRHSEVQSKKFGEPRYFPRALDPDRSVWRGLDALLADSSDGSSSSGFGVGVANWIDYLVVENVLERSMPTRPHALALNYINQSSVIGASIDDELQIRLAVIGARTEARSFANRAVISAEQAVAAVAGLARNLASAAGGDGDGRRSTVRAEAFFALDAPFRRWIADLGADTDFEAYIESWQLEVREIVGAMARELIANAGAPAWKGREVNGRWLDSPRASRYFWAELRNALPAAFGPNNPTRGRDS